MRRYVITAGTSAYANTFALPSVPQDLTDVGAALGSVGYALALTLTDPRADELRRALDTWASSDVRGDDVLVLYYTGHGERDADRHYLLCADSVPGRLAGTALATEDVVRILTSEGVRRLLLIVDTCYAGQGTIDAVQEAARLQRTRLMETPASDLLTFAVIAAARTRETATDGAFAHAFTAALTNPGLAGQRQRHLELKQLVISVNAELRRRNVHQRATYGVLVDDDDFSFLPNPHYRADLPSEGVDLAVQRTWVSIEGRRRREELASHFQPRALGTVDAESDGQDYFSGRAAVLARLSSGTGSVIVTGSAGVGKSAVLGRLVVTTSLVDVAIHVRHKVVDDVVSGIAAALNTPATTPEDLLAALTDPPVDHLADRSTRIVIDALDEAGSPGDREPARIARFLRDLARLPNVRLIIGTRPHVAPTLGDGFDRINLDDPEWVTHEDLVAYARKLLTAPHGPGSTSAYSVSAAVMVAERIATQSYPNYLKVRLAARAFANREDVPVLPPGDTGEVFRWALSEQLGPSDARARALLTPLAFAEGAGLPWGTIWPAVAAAVSGAVVSTEDIEWLLRSSAQEHVVEVVDEVGRSVYRLYHEAFADQLRKDAPPDTQSRIVDALGIDWANADPYVRTHLPTHAAAAGRLAELAADPGFLLAADRASLVRTLQSIASRNANAYLHAVVQLADTLTPAERASVLGMSAYRAGAKELVAALDEHPMAWRVRWSSVEETYQGRRIGLHDNDVTAVASGEVNGQQVLVTGDDHGEIRLWDVETGEQVGAAHRTDAGPIGALYVLTTPTGVVVVGVDTFSGRVHGWYPETGQSIHLDTGGWSTATACRVVDGRVLVATAGRRGRVQLWDLASGKRLMTRRAWLLRDADVVRLVTVQGRAVLLITAEVWPGVEMTSVSMTLLRRRRNHRMWLRGEQVLDALDLDDQATLVTHAGWGPTPWSSGRLVERIRVAPDFDTWAYAPKVVELPDRTLAVCAAPAVVLWKPESREIAGKVTFEEIDSGTGELVSFRTPTGTWLARPAGRSVQAINVAEAGDVVLPAQRGPRSLALANDLVYVSTGSVAVWKSLECLDLATGRQAHHYPDHERVERLFGGGSAPVFISRKLDDQYAVYELRVPDKPWRFDPDRIWFYRRPKGTRFMDYSVAVGTEETVVAAVGRTELVYWRLSAADVHHRRLPVRVASSCVALVDGNVLLLAELRDDAALALVDVDSGEIRWRHQDKGDWTASPCVAQVDGRTVGVINGTGGAIMIVDLLTGDDIGHPLIGHSLAPDAYDVVTYEGRPLLVSGSDDRTARVWDLRTRTQLVAIDVGSVVTSVKFAPSSQAIIVGTEASVLRIELDQI